MFNACVAFALTFNALRERSVNIKLVNEIRAVEEKIQPIIHPNLNFKTVSIIYISSSLLILILI